MKSIIFCEKKSVFIKYAMFILAAPLGLVISVMLAYFNIDFKELINLFIENISDPDMFEILMPVMSTWYLISFILFLAALFLLVIYSGRNPKSNVDVLTWEQTAVFTFILIFIVQIVLPLFTAVIAIAICLLYLVVFSSIFLQNIIRYGTLLFVLFVEKICTTLGIELTYGEFIDSTDYFIFLTLITILILIPYILSFLLKMIRKFMQKVTRTESVELFFKPVETFLSVNVLRYVIYLLLFFISVITYSVSSISVPGHDNIFPLVKEALLEFVILDTVIYSIFSDMRNKLKNRKKQKTRANYIPFKYDLEFVLSAITMHSLKDKNIDARIKFSVDINSLPKAKEQKDISTINTLLFDISTNYYKIDALEQKIKVALSTIIALIE